MSAFLTARQTVTDAAHLVLPVACAGCGRWDTALCPECASLLVTDLQAVDDASAAGDLDVWALGTYAGPVREMVVAWKRGRREDLGPVLTGAMGRAAARWTTSQADLLQPDVHLLQPSAQPPGPSHAPSRIPDTGPGGHGGTVAPSQSPVLVVPAPSGPGRRLRGLLVAADLADAVALGLARGLTGAVGVASVDLLRRRRGTGAAHQSGRSSRQRRSNRAVPPRVLADVAGCAVVLVDDVVTTGATLAACSRAVEEAGARVLAALVLAATPAPGARRRVALSPPGPGGS